MEDDDELTRVIQEQVDEWSSNSNECFTVQLVRGDGSISASAHPEFTYAIFGDEEAIFGYQDLDITLSFRAHDLDPKLDVKYSKKFEQGEIRASDITLGLSHFLPQSAFDGKALEAPEADFNPPGEKIREYTRDGRIFEVWCASLADSTARRMLENMQILAPLYIDGGSVLELEQDWTTQRWKLFLAYEVDRNAGAKVSPYSLIGYGTSYRSFTFPERHKDMPIDVFSPSSQSIDDFLPASSDEPNQLREVADFKSPLDLPSRERLSQFLILPPFQAAGHGQELYNAMYKHLTSPENVREFTVEDPNDAFDDLRDRCDLLHLRANVPEFAALKVNTDISPEKLGSDSAIPVELIVPLEARNRISRDTKIMPRQFDRLVEMHTLSFIPQANRSRSRLTKKEKATNPADKAYFFWRLYVKQRLYVFNRDQLAQVEHAERVEKLEAALDSVLEKYDEIMEAVEAREKANEEDGQMRSSTKTPKRKRRVVEDEDEDEDGEPGAEQESAAPSTNGRKKSRT